MSSWDDLRFFLAVARSGSMSRAARVLRVTQPTVGRRIAALEERLGARLFTRTSQRLSPTPAGRSMLAHVERIEREARDAERAVAGRDAGLRGTVRVTTSEWLAARLVGPALAPLALRHPELTIELIADPVHANLARGDADLAIRPSEFGHASVVQRRVGRVAFALYGSRGYLARHGAPDFARGCEGHAILAMSDDVGDAARAWLVDLCGAARVAVRTNGREAMASMVAAGAGLAFLPRVVGDPDRRLERVPTPRPLPDRALWLGVHRDARAIPRVRAVASHLASELARASRGA